MRSPSTLHDLSANVRNRIVRPSYVRARAVPRRAKDRWATRHVPQSAKTLADDVRREALTYCTAAQLRSLSVLCADAERSGEAGVIVEAGCARGGSALVLCAVKSPTRPLDVYDVFGMIPPPSEHDGPDMHERFRTIAAGEAVALDGGTYYAYEDDLAALVERQFREHGFPIAANGVRLVTGKVQDTMAIDGPVVLAHIDVDWYEPVTHCLEQIVPNLSRSGAVVLHAYKDWSGCHRATDEYFDRVGRDGFTFDDSSGHLVVRRTHG